MRVLSRILLIIALLAAPLIVTAQSSPSESEKPETVTAPETVEEGTNILWQILKALPQGVINAWHEHAVPIWNSMWNIIQPILEDAWNWIVSLFRDEIEEKQPVLEEQLEKEQEELKEELQRSGTRAKEGIFEKFRSLFRPSPDEEVL